MKQRIIKPGERILERSSRLVRQQVNNATGISQIVEESGAVKSSVCQTFGSNRKIALAYLMERDDFWFEGLATSISSAQGTKSKLMDASDHISLINKKEDHQGCAFLNLLSEIPEKNILIRHVIVQDKQGLRNFLNFIT